MARLSCDSQAVEFSLASAGVGQRASVVGHGQGATAAADEDDFAEHGDGDLFGRLGADVESDRGVKTRARSSGSTPSSARCWRTVRVRRLEPIMPT